MTIEPLNNPERVAALEADKRSLAEALNEAISLLDAVAADANNVQLDIARWQRRHHRWVEKSD